MSDTVKHPTLSTAASAHIENLLDIESKRRPIDAALRSPIVEARDALFCAASNLECNPPQHQPGVAVKLRAAADLLVELDVARKDLHTLRYVLRIVRGPHLRQLAARVRSMARTPLSVVAFCGDADLVANSLVKIADSWDKHD